MLFLAGPQSAVAGQHLQKAHFRIVNDKKLVATVPRRARSGPIVVTSALKKVRSRGSFHVLR